LARLTRFEVRHGKRGAGEWCHRVCEYIEAFAAFPATALRMNARRPRPKITARSFQEAMDIDYAVAALLETGRSSSKGERMAVAGLRR
jgi:hypothetical protein